MSLERQRNVPIGPYPDGEMDLLAPHELFELPSIVETHDIDPASLGISPELAPARTVAVTVDDPYLRRYSAKQAEAVMMYERHIDTVVRHRRQRGLWAPLDGEVYIDGIKGKGDPPILQRIFDDLDRLGKDGFTSAGMQAWHQLIPSATALLALADPFSIQTLHNNRTHEVLGEMDDTSRLLLTLLSDPRGIRSRAAVMAKSFTEHIHASSLDDKHPRGTKWMSVACGTALPAMKAAIHAGIDPELLLLDWDRGAMSATQELATVLGFEGKLNQRCINIFNPASVAKLREELGSNGDRPTEIDMMGIFEYVSKHTASTGRDPALFLRSWYDMLAPGGRLVLGQMRRDRPNPDFTMGAVCWPHVVMRSPSEVMQIIRDAGIRTKTAQMFVPDDGVYTVCALDKPVGVESFAVC